MSLLEPPTVTRRPPPPSTPDLPLSPPPSRQGGRAPSEDRAARDTPPEGQSTAREESCERDKEGRLRRTRKAGGARRPGQPRWRTLLEEWRLWLTLENAGSVARDHLAAERTFLAYARTSLTIASTGVALVQLFTLSALTAEVGVHRFARPLGAVMIALGLCTLAVGVVRYFVVQEALIRGVYPVARVSAGVLSFVMLALVIVVFVVILIAR